MGMTTAELFVTVWQTSDSPGHVAKRLRVSLSSVHKRANRLRRAGVKLKYFRQPTDVTALNQIVCNSTP